MRNSTAKKLEMNSISLIRGWCVEEIERYIPQ